MTTQRPDAGHTGIAPSNDLQPVGFTLDPVSNPVYVFAPTSQHTNQVVIHLANPLPQAIPLTGEEIIEIVVSTTSPGDANPDALTTPDEVETFTIDQVELDASGAWVPTTPPTWTMQDLSHENDRYTFRLTPFKPHPPNVALDASGLVVSLDNVVTTLAGRTGKIEVSARNFKGLDPVSSYPYDMTIERYPAPLGNLHELPVQTAGAPLKASWTTQFVDTLTVKFTDVAGHVTSYSLEKGDIPASATDFEILPSLALAGWLEIFGANDSNTVKLYAQQRVDVAGTMILHGKLAVVASGCPTTCPLPPIVSGPLNALKLSWPKFAPVETWEVSPPGLMKSYTPTWSYEGNPSFQVLLTDVIAGYDDTVRIAFTTDQLPDLSINLKWLTSLIVNPFQNQAGLMTVLTAQWENQNTAALSVVSALLNTSSAINLSPEGLPAFLADVAPRKASGPSHDSVTVHNDLQGASGPDSYILSLDTDQTFSTGFYNVAIERPYQLDAGTPPTPPTPQETA